jgi:hypothetical protein
MNVATMNAPRSSVREMLSGDLAHEKEASVVSKEEEGEEKDETGTVKTDSENASSSDTGGKGESPSKGSPGDSDVPDRQELSEHDEANESDGKEEESVPKKSEAAQEIPPPDPILPSPPDSEEDEEVRLALEMALAAAQNPHLTPAQIRKLVGEKNKQAKIVEEAEKHRQEEQKQKQEREKEEAQQRWIAKKENAYKWWSAKSKEVQEVAARKAEEMKDRAERRIYAEQIRTDKEVIALRKKKKILRKTIKAHRLQGNRVETRHSFKRQRMEKKLMQMIDKLHKTQRLFTHSNYNVQEYLKAMMRASKKWRKKGNDKELMLEAQLCRNMHQMLALEKQRVKCKKSTREMKKYLQRCKGWLSDKKAFCEMNQITLEATQNSMLILYEEILERQDALISKLKASEEFEGIDLSQVDISHVKIPELPMAQRKASLEAAKSLQAQKQAALAQQQAQRRQGGGRDLYVETNDDISVSSHLTDPDADPDDISMGLPGGEQPASGEESQSMYSFGNDAPWMHSSSNVGSSASDSHSGSGRGVSVGRRSRKKDPPKDSVEQESREEEEDKKPAAQTVLEKKQSPVSDDPEAEKKEPEEEPNTVEEAEKQEKSKQNTKQNPEQKTKDPEESEVQAEEVETGATNSAEDLSNEKEKIADDRPRDRTSTFEMSESGESALAGAAFAEPPQEDESQKKTEKDEDPHLCYSDEDQDEERSAKYISSDEEQD